MSIDSYVESRGDSSVSAIPRWQTFMVFILSALHDGSSQHRKSLELRVLDLADIGEAQRLETLNTGNSRVLNRIGWGLSELIRAAAISRPARGFYQITDVGRQLLHENPKGFDVLELKDIPAWNDYIPSRISTKKPEGLNDVEVLLDSDDPAELIAAGIQKFENDVADQLLKKLRDGDPGFFEEAVVELLKAMGYGGAEKQVQRLGQTGDGGVDGVINQDALGLSRVYVQAKRYAEGNTVGRPDLQKFVGALADKGALHGVFVTTSSFTLDARNYVEKIPNRVVLLDGSRLVELMLQYRVGVQVHSTYYVLEIHEDFFEAI
jgi:restriction system protein